MLNLHVLSTVVDKVTAMLVSTPFHRIFFATKTEATNFEQKDTSPDSFLFDFRASIIMVWIGSMLKLYALSTGFDKVTAMLVSTATISQVIKTDTKFEPKDTSPDSFLFSFKDSFMLAWIRRVLKWHVLSIAFDKVTAM
jgi:hypothetical protein